MSDRCAYPQAKKVIYSIKGNAQFNSECAITLRDGLKRGKVKLLTSELEGKEFLKKLSKFKDLPLDIQTTFEAPFIQTTLLINEMINLEGERTDSGLIKLKEPRSKRKDRYSSVTYGNFIASELERSLFKEDNHDDYNFFFYN
jgi:hypothetical protein